MCITELKATDMGKIGESFKKLLGNLCFLYPNTIHLVSSERIP